MSFPGAKTQWHTVPATSPGNWEQNNAAAAEAESIDVANSIIELRSNASALATLALKYINECRAFSADITSVNYVPPTFAGAQLVTVDTDWSWPAVSDLIIPTTATPDFSKARIVGEFTASEDIERPAITPTVLPVKPFATSPQQIPNDPTILSIDVPETPVYVYPLITSVPVPPPLGLAPVYKELPDPIMLKAISFPEINDAGVTNAFSALEAIIKARPTIPIYSPYIPSVFQVIGALLAGPPEYVVNATRAYTARRATIEDRQSSFINTVYSRRGLVSVDSSAYISKEKARTISQAEAYRVVTIALAADDSIRDAYKVGTAAHAQAVELLIAITDSEFDALFANAEAQGELWNAAVASYQGVAATFENKAQAYTLAFTEEEARVQNYTTQMDSLKVRAGFESTTARYFASTEQSKALTLDINSLLVDTEKAKVQAFSTSNRAVAARAEALGIEFEQYQALVAKWTGSLAAVQATWKEASARAKAIAATNQAIAQRVAASGESNLIIATEAQKAAAYVAAQAERLKANISQRSSAFAVTEASNQIAGALAQNISTIYSTGLTQLTQKVTAESANIEGRAVEAAAASRFFVQAAEAAGRAATLTQQANIQLAEAYSMAQETSGKATAAIEAGRFGGYSARVSLSASAELGASEHSGRRVDNSYAVTTSESDSYQESLNMVK